MFERNLCLGNLLLAFGQPGFSRLTLAGQLRFSGREASNLSGQAALLLLQGLAFVANALFLIQQTALFAFELGGLAL